MIYLPKRFENENLELSIKLIQDYPLATLVSVQESLPFFSHIPLVIFSCLCFLFLSFVKRTIFFNP